MKQITLFLVLLSAASISCRKEGCIDVEAENYNEDAKIDDGTCSYQRDNFLGTYQVSESCTYKDNGPYSVKVLEGPNKNEIVLENLYNEGERLRAEISNNEATFKEDVVGLTYEGKAYMTGSELNVDYEVCETFFYPCTDIEACALKGVK